MLFCGIDVSKESLDICILEKNKEYYYKVENSLISINQFFKSYLDKNITIGFETTGHYSDYLASALSDLGLDFKELNPTKTSLFLKHLNKLKTDKTDAFGLATYIKHFGNQISPKIFDKKYKQIQSYNSTLNLFTKIQTQISNFKKSKDFVADENIIYILKTLQTTLKELDEKLNDLAYSILVDYIPQTDEIVKNCVGIGKKLAISLFPILHKNKDKNHKNIISFLGLAPVVYESGTSVRKARHINKIGSSYIRSVLFMATMSAIKHNEVIKERFNNLVNKGKNKKLAIVACMCKIVKWLKNVYFKKEEILQVN